MKRLETWSWACLLCAATAVVSHAQGFRTLTSFDIVGYPEYVSLVQASDGEVYGTTVGEGGVIFKITTGGELTILCYFGESLCPPYGSRPFAGLTLAADGNFYGTTWQGWAGGTAGTVFEYTAGGQPSTLYNFCSKSNCADGDEPFAPLLQAGNGNFYGTTFSGGTNGYGTIFEITSQGTLTTLHSFAYALGAGPVAGLVQAKNGNFYGTTLYGGAHGAGTVFEITSGGKLRTLHSFGSARDGANPYAGLAQAKDGNFYGTTYGGGAHGQGTVFRITSAGKLRTLYSFCAQQSCADGAYPYAGLIQATNGNFYGTTSAGGASHWGTVFAITAGGRLGTLHSFCSKKNCTDGADPVGGLLQASDGNFYGTTTEGGAYEAGTIFRLSLGLQAVAEDDSASAEDEAPAPIWGTGPMHARFAGANKPVHDSDARANILSFARKQLAPGVQAPPLVKPKLTCSPAPCVLPPTQASEGGGIVTDPLIVTNPLNQKELLLGSFDANCPPPSALGFHLSRDGGSSWTRVECMPTIIKKNSVWWPTFEPAVGFDRKGNTYVAGSYSPSEGSGGFVGVQKNGGKPVVALRRNPFESFLTVDTSAHSPRVNSVYVSGVVFINQGNANHVEVSHSTDGGATWTQAAVDPVQKDPAGDDFTRMAVGKDGTVYVTWLHCPGPGPDTFCADGTSYMMFSKSSDGGDTWSPPRLMTKAQFVAPGLLTNTKYGERVYNYPAIAVDNSNGSHSGNLYVTMYSWTGTYLRVQVIRSTDGGNTWSQPVALAPETAIHDQFFPAISVSPTGLVGVSWLDRRNDPANHNYQAFAAISSDGGQSFGRNWQLTSAFSNPDKAYNWMGDYAGNTWAGGNFIAAWMDSSNGIDMQEVVGGIRLK